MTFKQKKCVKNPKNKYLKPGALAQLRYNTVASRSCTDIGKKRVILDTKKKSKIDILRRSQLDDGSPLIRTPERIIMVPVGGLDETKQHQLLVTPKTPKELEWVSQSRLESLPMDLLVKVLCHLHHDELRAVFHVSQRIRKAVSLARQYHFNYTTPDRSRQEMLRTKTPLPTEHWPFISKTEGNRLFGSSPVTPSAPKHAPRPPRPNPIDIKQVAAVLFQEPRKNSKFVFPPCWPKPISKSLASNRVLFYEDELCHAVAQNKLR